MSGNIEKWEKIKLEDLCLIERGGSPRPIKNFITKDPNGINWIKIGDAKVNSKYIDSTNEKIIIEGSKYSRKVKKGDFILSNSMSFGRPYILNIDGCIHDGWLVLSDFSNKINKDFLYYILSSSIVKKQFENEARGAIVKNLNIDIVKKVIIPLPELEEQIRIVKIIEKKLTTIKKVETLNTEQLFNCDLLKDKLFRKIFEENKNWKNVSLNNVADISAGGDKPDIFSENKTKDNPIPVIANAIKNDGIVGYTNKIIIEKNSITVSARGTIGYSSIRNYPYYPIVRLISIIPNEDIVDINYLKFIFDILYEKGVGTSIPQLTIPMIVNKQIPLPQLNEQKNIVNLIKSQFNAVKKLKNVISEQSTYINALPSSILRKAFIGDY